MIEKYLSVFMLLVIMMLSVIRGDSQLEESDAATFIPFIMHLIRGNLTHDEKLNISQNLYSAYKKKINGKNVINKEDNVAAKVDKLAKKGQHVPQRNYVLRF